jgi:HK97 gp10 family phage protein
MATEAIKIKGLAEFNRNLKKLDSDLPKALRVALNSAADVIVDAARPRVPRRTGRAAAALKARSTRTAARVSGGSARAPYYAWLDFGGEGRRKGRPSARPFIKQGRYLYAAYYQKRDSGEFEQILTKALLDVATQAGVEVE